MQRFIGLVLLVADIIRVPKDPLFGPLEGKKDWPRVKNFIPMKK